jgi:hypothetical protein
MVDVHYAALLQEPREDAERGEVVWQVVEY